MTMSTACGSRARCCIRHDDGRPHRLLVHWETPDRQEWRRIFTQFRATFHSHRRASYREAGQCWSMPASQKAELLAWAEANGLEVVLPGSKINEQPALAGRKVS